MLHPQIVVFESDARVGPLLEPLATAERWALRTPRQRQVCRDQLQASTPTVLVVRLDDSSETELKMIGDASAFPHISVVAVGSVDDAEHLAGLTWDCGADFALFPPLSRDLLPEIVRGLMTRTIQRALP